MAEGPTPDSNGNGAADAGITAGRHGDRAATGAAPGTEGRRAAEGGERPVTPRTVDAATRRVTEAGAGEVLLTSMDRDGTKSGYDLELLRAGTGAVAIPVIAPGGGGGIMGAANRGASEAGAPSIGFNIELMHAQQPNAYSTPDLTFQFRYFGMRKMHLVMRAAALVVFPGGFGTLDELFEILTLTQTSKTPRIPIVCFDRAYWTRIINFDALAEAGMISRSDLRLIEFAEDAEQADLAGCTRVRAAAKFHGITVQQSGATTDLDDAHRVAVFVAEKLHHVLARLHVGIRNFRPAHTGILKDAFIDEFFDVANLLRRGRGAGVPLLPVRPLPGRPRRRPGAGRGPGGGGREPGSDGRPPGGVARRGGRR